MRVLKVDVLRDRITDYGGVYDEDDVKLITNGYRFNGLFYTRKNSHFIFIVKPD